MARSLRFAIVGCGRIASRHAAEIIKHGELVACCDPVRDKSDAFSRQFSAKAYSKLDDLLTAEKGLDLISICSPNGLHPEHSICSLRAGIHVLCEKPMAISSADGQRMIEAAREAGKRLFIVKQNRFNPPVAFVKSLLNENKLGRISGFQLNCFWNRPPAYFMDDWRGTLDLDGGTLYTQFSHFIDLLYWFLGDVAEAKGTRYNFLHKDLIDFEDTGVAFLKMASGAIGTINYSINAYSRNMEGSLTLFGENGTVKIGGQYLNELEYFAVAKEDRPELPKGRPPHKYGDYEGSMSNHDKVYEATIRAINDKDYSFITNEEALKTVEIIEKIYKASPLVQ